MRFASTRCWRSWATSSPSSLSAMATWSSALLINTPNPKCWWGRRIEELGTRPRGGASLYFSIPNSSMPLYQVIVLAVVQGITEFLPISSTAHLWLVPWLFGWQDPGLMYDVALHLGTLLAVAVDFARSWIDLLLHAFGRKAKTDQEIGANSSLFWFLVVATIPAGLAGLALEHYAESRLRSPYVIASTMIGVALFLWWAERKSRYEKDLGKVTL